MPEKDITTLMWVAGSFVALWQFFLTTILGYHIKTMGNLREDIKDSVPHQECKRVHELQDTRLKGIESGVKEVHERLDKLLVRRRADREK